MDPSESGQVPLTSDAVSQVPDLSRVEHAMRHVPIPSQLVLVNARGSGRYQEVGAVSDVEFYNDIFQILCQGFNDGEVLPPQDLEGLFGDYATSPVRVYDLSLEIFRVFRVRQWVITEYSATRQITGNQLEYNVFTKLTILSQMVFHINHLICRLLNAKVTGEFSANVFIRQEHHTPVITADEALRDLEYSINGIQVVVHNHMSTMIRDGHRNGNTLI
ncbi:hypothetical protein F5Y02DRAFT_416456 [Annulohypoxylon stygium]|nr:hypothetical protein F5Y02DRAFT_416456 [Annulohypoxylon stygium]